MRGLLDTSVVVATGPLARLEEGAISAATLAELHFGIHLAKNDAARAARLRRLAEIEATFAALPIDEAVARAYGELAARTIAAGRRARRRVMDTLIAATARALQVPLYTLNPEDFAPFADLVEIRSE